MRSPRAIALYLPQFHPIPENDEWWGKGFTEWTNVAKARPRFRGHRQPHLPADLGFYDLRVSDVQEAQAALARQYGIHGFCYYHYWFNGRRLLERPVDQLLARRKPDFPFCLCWANENWSRTWDGEGRQMLMEQRYSPEDDRAHFRELLRYLGDERYIRVHGKPLLIVYRALNLPDPAQTAQRWRDMAKAEGLGGLYLAYVEVTNSDKVWKRVPGFDAAVEFAPDWGVLPEPLPMLGRHPVQRIAAKLGLGEGALGRDLVYSYDALAANMLAKPAVDYTRFPCVTPRWDNTARRRSGARIFKGSTPESYEAWLGQAIRQSNPPSAEEDLVFINAWNEWAEGAHLEPCADYKHAYLEATRRALNSAVQSSPLPTVAAHV